MITHGPNKGEEMMGEAGYLMLCTVVLDFWGLLVLVLNACLVADVFRCRELGDQSMR